MSGLADIASIEIVEQDVPSTVSPVQTVEVSNLNTPIDVELIDVGIPIILSQPAIADHGDLTGLADDDHPQYLNDTRGDARYYTKGQMDTSLAGKAATSHTHTSAQVTDLVEFIQDTVATTLVGSGVTVTYDDAAGTVTIAGAGSTDLEAVRDAIGVALIGVGLISVTVDDPGNTITISTAATQNSTDAALRDRATHTGVQAISTISGLQSAIDAKENVIAAGTTAQYRRGDKTWQTLNADAVPDGTTNKAYTSTEKTKLAGIASGATANSPDATLLNRANHTGTQLASTISDSTAPGRAILNGADYPTIRGLIGAGTSNLVIGTTSTTAKAGDYVPSWGEISSKPSTFAPSAHNHAIADVTSLQTTLDAKAALTHTHDDRYYTEAETDALLDSKVVGDINGRVPLASLAPGTTFAIDSNGSGGWTLNGTVITSRPSGAGHLKMVAYGGTAAPSFAIAGDIWYEAA